MNEVSNSSSTWKMPQQNRNQNYSKPIPRQKPSGKSKETSFKPAKSHRKRSIINSRLCGKPKH